MNITATLFVQVAAFVTLIWLLNRYLWGPLTQAMDRRCKGIAAGIAAGEQGLKLQKEAQEKASEMRENAHKQATDIIEKARQRAASIEEKAKTAAGLESAKARAAFEQEMSGKIGEAQEKLKKQLAALVVQGVREVVHRECDARVHADVFERLQRSM